MCSCYIVTDMPSQVPELPGPRLATSGGLWESLEQLGRYVQYSGVSGTHSSVSEVCLRVMEHLELYGVLRSTSELLLGTSELLWSARKSMVWSLEQAVRSWSITEYLRYSLKVFGVAPKYSGVVCMVPE